MTAECCCTVKSIALDHQSLEHQQITDESDLRCSALNVCIYASVCFACVCVGEGESEMKRDEDNDDDVCKRELETKARK